MAMVRNDTMIKKMRGNIATLVKKNETIQGKADKEMEANNATIAVLEETIAKFEALEPKLPLPDPNAAPAEGAAAESLPILDAIEKATGTTEGGEAGSGEAEEQQQTSSESEEEQEEEEKRLARKSSSRRR